MKALEKHQKILCDEIKNYSYSYVMYIWFKIKHTLRFFLLASKKIIRSFVPRFGAAIYLFYRGEKGIR